MATEERTGVDAAARLADRLAHPEGPLLDATTRADALQRLRAEAEDLDRPDLAALAAALLAEHLLLHGDPSGLLLALTTLAGLPDDPLPPPLLAQARARLRRAVLAAGVALDPTADTAADLQACLADFLRAGRHEDRWLTVALVRTLRVATAWTATPADRAAVVEARDQLHALSSPLTAWARFAVATLAHSLGDAAGVRAELATLRAEASTPAAVHLVALLEAVRSLVDAAPGPRADEAVARLAEVADLVRREVPAVSAGVVVLTTHALLDAGRADDAGAWLGRLGALPVVQPHEDAERTLMELRLGLLTGDAPPDDDVLLARAVAAVGALADGGRPRMAGALALRTAMTARTAGRDAVARALLDRGDELVTPPRTGWETWWRDRAGAPAAATTAHRLALLTPSAGVVVGGRHVPLAAAHARLLAVLACAGHPLSTDALVEQLWPDADPVAARRRLKSAHHRLRLLLGPDADDLVRRDRDVWSVVPGGRWSVDVADFTRLAAGDREDRLVAFRLPTGLLWNAQLPFDEVLAPLRAPLEVRWLALAHGLLADNTVTEDEVAERAAPLGVVTTDM